MLRINLKPDSKFIAFKKSLIRKLTDPDFWFPIYMVPFLLLLFLICLPFLPIGIPLYLIDRYRKSIKYYSIVIDCAPQEFPMFRQALLELVRKQDRERLESNLRYVENSYAFATKRSAEWAVMKLCEKGIPCHTRRIGIKKPANSLFFQPDDYLSEPEDFLLWVRISP